MARGWRNSVRCDCYHLTKLYRYCRGFGPLDEALVEPDVFLRAPRGRRGGDVT